MQRAFTIHLGTGEPVLIRPIRRDDEVRLREAIMRLSDRSRYLRFFSGARRLPDAVIRQLVDVDGQRHVAWGALDMSDPDQPTAIAAVHAIRSGDAGEAELAFGVLDAYHGQGLARLLIDAVVSDVRAIGLRELVADVLVENTKARRLLAHIGMKPTGATGEVAQYRGSVESVAVALALLDSPQQLPRFRDALCTGRDAAA